MGKPTWRWQETLVLEEITNSDKGRFSELRFAQETEGEFACRKARTPHAALELLPEESEEDRLKRLERIRARIKTYIARLSPNNARNRKESGSTQPLLQNPAPQLTIFPTEPISFTNGFQEFQKSHHPDKLPVPLTSNGKVDLGLYNTVTDVSEAYRAIPDREHFERLAREINEARSATLNTFTTHATREHPHIGSLNGVTFEEWLAKKLGWSPGRLRNEFYYYLQEVFDPTNPPEIVTPPEASTPNRSERAAPSMFGTPSTSSSSSASTDTPVYVFHSRTDPPSAKSSASAGAGPRPYDMAPGSPSSSPGSSSPSPGSSSSFSDPFLTHGAAFSNAVPLLPRTLDDSIDNSTELERIGLAVTLTHRGTIVNTTATPTHASSSRGAPTVFSSASDIGTTVADAVPEALSIAIEQSRAAVPTQGSSPASDPLIIGRARGKKTGNGAQTATGGPVAEGRRGLKTLVRKNKDVPAPVPQREMPQRKRTQTARALNKSPDMNASKHAKRKAHNSHETEETVLPELMVEESSDLATKRKREAALGPKVPAPKRRRR
ncbi:hypothetical protein VTO73DRAFT_3256 [Trametes versicolor]